MTEPEFHWEYITHVTHVKDGDHWPISNGSILVSGSWCQGRKLITIEPHRRVGGQYAHIDEATGLAVWWVEKVKVNNVPPAPQVTPKSTEYEKLREELGV